MSIARKIASFWATRTADLRGVGRRNKERGGSHSGYAWLGAEFHDWHHEACDSNFGVLRIFDVLCGTASSRSKSGASSTKRGGAYCDRGGNESERRPKSE